MYNHLGETEREFLHEDVGNVLEELYGDQAHEIAVQLARHFVEAGLDDRALGYLIQAGDAAYRQYANTEAVAHYTRALNVALHSESTSQQLVHLYTQRGRILELENRYEEALSNYEEMSVQAEHLDSQELRLASLNALGTVYAVPSAVTDFERAKLTSEQALALAQELGDRAAEARALWNLLLVYRFGFDEPQQAAGYGEASLEIARDLEQREQLAYILGDLAAIYAQLGHRRKAQILVHEAQKCWHELGNLPMLANALTGSAMISYETGDFQSAVEAADQGIEVAEASGNTFVQIFTRSLTAYVHRDRGDYGTVFRFLETGIRLGREHSMEGFTASCALTLALAYCDLGQVEPARALCHQALQHVDAAPRFINLPDLHHTLQANLHLMDGNLSAAREAITKCRFDTSMAANSTAPSLLWPSVVCAVALASQDYDRVTSLADEIIDRYEHVGMRAGLPDVLYFKGRAQLARGDVEAAWQTLNRASTDAESMGARRILWQILAALAEIESRRGHVAEAENLRAQAREVIAFIADHAGTPELCASFLTRPDVRAVLEERAE